MTVGVSGYIGQRKTGIGRNTENILIHTAKINSSDIYYLFTNYDQHDFKNVDWPKNVVLVFYKVSCKSPILNILWHQLFFQYKLWKYNCDVSLVPNFSLLLWKVCPTIVILNDLIEFHVKNKFNYLRMIYRYISVPLLAHRADLIITISNSSKNDIVKILKVKESKVHVAYCGYDPLIFKMHPFEKIKSSLAKYSIEPYTYILSIGTVDYPGKNVYSFIKSYFILRDKKCIDFKLVIIGKPGHNFHKIMDLVNSSDYRKDVIFLGFVDDEDLPFFYNGALLFGFLSFYEGFGLPVLEAMASGCPVITSNVSSLPEIVGSAGCLVDPNNLDDITLAMEKLLTSKDLRQRYKQEGLEQAKKFSWQESAKIYSDILSKKYFN